MHWQMERDKAEAERVKTEKKAELVRKQEEAKLKAETARKVRAEEAQRRKREAEAAQRTPRSPIRFIGLPDDEDDAAEPLQVSRLRDLPCLMKSSASCRMLQRSMSMGSCIHDQC